MGRVNILHNTIKTIVVLSPTLLTRAGWALFTVNIKEVNHGRTNARLGRQPGNSTANDIVFRARHAYALGTYRPRAQAYPLCSPRTPLRRRCITRYSASLQRAGGQHSDGPLGGDHPVCHGRGGIHVPRADSRAYRATLCARARSEEHTSELQSQFHLVCRLLPPN